MKYFHLVGFLPAFVFVPVFYLSTRFLQPINFTLHLVGQQPYGDTWVVINDLSHVTALLRVVLVVLDLRHICTFYLFGVVDLNFKGFAGQHKFWDLGESTAQIRGFSAALVRSRSVKWVVLA